MKSIELIRAVMDVLTDVWDRSKQIDDAADEVLGLIEARQLQDREDAERYRWLRDPCSGAEHVIFYSRGDYGKGLMSGEMLDEAIDHARRKDQASRLLARLKEEGKLEQHGQRRWAYYVLGSGPRL